ncbi:similar to Saccharomyces cerevisiae YKL084W HOT13 Zinc-binding mitochondrial intermembrane space (IMS) protein involved in a disulfide relay system for IMS import of cysteine-containing proteins [Maudiozyma barnettii]|uniref:Similar to Saccharomyces cerevisiae YKL084W HOT13 Zinc-binding mitochondrial intermembrane space (IMS) protein involved in a disulfide relay system for IMS import of cysteine-containing proteins n=1 Tax=Maudiozyma barnettii TaxID=61262 RepID=A0A8H2VIK1_9SACH|nr:Hot13p [Kazachstania barnettii]CAB4256086.1 similar to Saccharomyces cerevisiae YKL084W HOT13 Zinc-binding mitochondrial intermembrane space (IMS) protein involved in a disulfide relay system for IMS import of cysteine-containing proteins [Kazachstania barnettii]CAD1784694.1 similar to Saccharomyces cerevisiae YKL084W HOT13 Zinc-binding mitochondrial intermembrane space (IMS) protein involved in a disulfide relay system for IMS import of cysteine-containing proteins [Kazachstania barnettii]
MVKLVGKLVDDQTRCIHWNSQLDVMAIKFKCCQTFYPCFECHQEVANHDPIRYDLKIEKDATTSTILCGICHNEMTFNEYSNGIKCTSCLTDFNPGCKLHYGLYFENVPSNLKLCSL